MSDSTQAAFERVDVSLQSRPELVTPEVFGLYASKLSHHPQRLAFEQLKNKSMLHVDVLLLLRLMGLATKTTVLEIGPYIGGSTIAIAEGLKKRGGPPLLSIEAGGSYDHPEYPSSDIVSDLRANVAAAGLDAFSSIIVGYSDSAAVIEQFKAQAKSPLNFLFVDADGDIERDIRLYGPFLSEHALLAFDDYNAPGAREKELVTKQYVDEQVAKGVFEEFGVFGWGTWFGRLRSGQSSGPVGGFLGRRRVKATIAALSAI